MTSGLRSSGALAGACLAFALVVPSLAAQTLAPLSEAYEGSAVGLVHVEARPGSTIVAVSLALPVGSAADPEAREGTARAVAGAVARHVEAALGPGGGPTQVEVTAYRTVITVLAPSEAWPVAIDALVEHAFRSGLDPTLASAELAGMEDVLVFEAGAPIADVRFESARLLLGAGDRGVRPSGGTVEGVRALDAASLTAFLREHYDPSRAVLAVVGVPDTDTTLRRLGVAVPEADPPEAEPPPAIADSASAGTPEPATEPAVDRPQAPQTTRFDGPLAWTAGDRLRIVQDVTSSWIMAAYPVPGDLPRTLVEFVAHRLHEDLNPTPTDPGLFSARVQLRDLPDGPALVIEVAVLPDAAESWEARVLGAVESLATPLDESFFLWQRRRFRSARLLGEAAPEVAARRHAVDLLTLGGVRDLRAALWQIDAAGLTAAVTSLGPPRILVYGPDLAAGPPAR